MFNSLLYVQLTSHMPPSIQCIYQGTYHVNTVITFLSSTSVILGVKQRVQKTLLACNTPIMLSGLSRGTNQDRQRRGSKSWQSNLVWYAIWPIWHHFRIQVATRFQIFMIVWFPLTIHLRIVSMSFNSGNAEIVKFLPFEFDALLIAENFNSPWAFGFNLAFLFGGQSLSCIHVL